MGPLNCQRLWGDVVPACWATVQLRSLPSPKGFTGQKNPVLQIRVRRPRTLAGVTAQGFSLRSMVVSRDGAWARALKAHRLCNRWEQWMRLDGGGSTTMTIGNQLVNRPSHYGERPLPTLLLSSPSSNAFNSERGIKFSDLFSSEFGGMMYVERSHRPLSLDNRKMSSPGRRHC